MAYIDDLKTWRQNLIDKLKGLSTSAVGGKPNKTGSVGENVDHMGYRAQLLSELKSVEQLIQQAEDEADAETYGDYEGEVRGWI